MTSYNLYPTVPSAPEDPQVAYHLNIIQSKRQGLLKLEKRYEEKSKKYTKILNQLMWLNTCASGISIATGISGVATLSTLISLPLSIPLGTVYLAGVSASGLTTLLTKEYQQKLTKVAKLTDIITSAITVFERVVSKALKNGRIDEESSTRFRLSTLKR